LPLDKREKEMGKKTEKNLKEKKLMMMNKNTRQEE
jgi:hypothetical protein